MHHLTRHLGEASREFSLTIYRSVLVTLAQVFHLLVPAAARAINFRKINSFECGKIRWTANKPITFSRYLLKLIALRGGMGPKAPLPP